MREFRKQIPSMKGLIVIIILSIIIFSMPQILRLAQENYTLIGQDSYENAWYAKSLDSNIIGKEPLGFSRITNIYNPYHLLLSLLDPVIPLELASRFLPILFGI